MELLDTPLTTPSGDIVTLQRAITKPTLIVLTRYYG